MCKINIDKNSCVHCGACTAVCSTNALKIDKSKWIIRYNSSKCTNCGNCIVACPLRAITPEIELINEKIENCPHV